MISRIFSEILEDTHYPLTHPGSVYPNGLIQNISITMGKTCEVYLESIVVTESTVSAILTYSVDGYTKKPLGSGILHKNLGNIMVLYSEVTGKAIGFMVLGALIDTANNYIECVKIFDSCIHVFNNGDATIQINGNKYDTPPELNILITGDLDVRESDSLETIVYNRFKESAQLLDADSIDVSGGIVSVNGLTSDTGTLVISMPTSDTGPLFTVVEGKDSSSSSSSSSSDDSSSSSSSGTPGEDSSSSTASAYTTITISLASDPTNNYKKYSDVLSLFTCPNSDILLDKIVSDTIDVTPVESPLDYFIDWYRDDSSSSLSNS